MLEIRHLTRGSTFTSKTPHLISSSLHVLGGKKFTVIRIRFGGKASTLEADPRLSQIHIYDLTFTPVQNFIRKYSIES